jgi:hypothetical protein
MVAGGLESLRVAGVSDSEIPDSLKQVEKAVTDRGPGAHPFNRTYIRRRSRAGRHVGGTFSWVRVLTSL